MGLIFKKAVIIDQIRWKIPRPFPEITKYDIALNNELRPDPEF